MTSIYQLTKEEGDALSTLCRDDGYTFVDNDLTVKTSNLQAPNLGAIVNLVQSLECMVGQKVKTEKVHQSEVDSALDDLTRQRTSNKDKTQLNAVEKQLRSLCQTAVNENSSDVHVLTTRESTKFLIRVHGTRKFIERFADNQNAKNQPRQVGLMLIDYVFSTLGNLDIQYQRPANDRFEIDLVVDGKSRTFEWRAALIPTFDGPKLTLRCLTPKDKVRALEDMDLPAPYVETLERMVHKRQGAIVVTGPMGGGKSSLVHAMLEKVDRIARNVHSLEDPVEFSQENVCKTQVTPNQETYDGSGVYLDYAFYCKETLRHDVDVSNIGEIRETLTAIEFCRKAETGGLAITTLHTNSAMSVPQTFIRQLKVPAAIVGAPDLMALFVHQKLVRTLCPHCAFSYAEREEEYVRSTYKKYGINSLDFKVGQLQKLCSEQELQSVKILNPDGCEKCDFLGESGRASVMELIVLDDEDRKFIIKEDTHGWKQHLLDRGWVDIKDHTKFRIVQGQVDILSASEQVDNLVPIPVSDIYHEMRGALQCK